VRVRREARAGGDLVVVPDAQAAPVDPLRVLVLGEGEVMAGVEPAVVGMAEGGEGADFDHGETPVTATRQCGAGMAVIIDRYFAYKKRKNSDIHIGLIDWLHPCFSARSAADSRAARRPGGAGRSRASAPRRRSRTGGRSARYCGWSPRAGGVPPPGERSPPPWPESARSSACTTGRSCAGSCGSARPAARRPGAGCPGCRPATGAARRTPRCPGFAPAAAG